MDLTKELQHSTGKLSLANIEETAEVVLLELLNSTSVSERELHLQALTGLHRVAVIKSVGDRRAEWNSVVGDLVAEPTKPAIDRLHGLVSYARQCAEEYRDEARVTNPVQADICDDFANKLQEILSEGGL